MPNGYDLSGRFLDFMQATSHDRGEMKTEIRTLKEDVKEAAIERCQQRQDFNTFKSWTETNMGKVIWKTVTALTAILGLAAAALMYFGGGS